MFLFLACIFDLLGVWSADMRICIKFRVWMSWKVICITGKCMVCTSFIFKMRCEKMYECGFETSLFPDIWNQVLNTQVDKSRRVCVFLFHGLERYDVLVFYSGCSGFWNTASIFWQFWISGMGVQRLPYFYVSNFSRENIISFCERYRKSFCCHGVLSSDNAQFM